MSTSAKVLCHSLFILAVAALVQREAPTSSEQEVALDDLRVANHAQKIVGDKSTAAGHENHSIPQEKPTAQKEVEIVAGEHTDRNVAPAAHHIKSLEQDQLDDDASEEQQSTPQSALLLEVAQKEGSAPQHPCVQTLTTQVSDRAIKTLIMTANLVDSSTQERSLLDALVRALIHLPFGTRLEVGGSSSLMEKEKAQADVLSGLAPLIAVDCFKEAPDSLAGTESLTKNSLAGTESLTKKEVKSWEEEMLKYLQCTRRKGDMISHWLRTLQRDVLDRVERLAKDCKALQLTPSLDSDQFSALVLTTQKQLTRVEEDDLPALDSEIRDVSSSADWVNTEMSNAYLKLTESKERQIQGDETFEKRAGVLTNKMFAVYGLIAMFALATCLCFLSAASSEPPSKGEGSFPQSRSPQQQGGGGGRPSPSGMTSSQQWITGNMPRQMNFASRVAEDLVMGPAAVVGQEQQTGHQQPVKGMHHTAGQHHHHTSISPSGPSSANPIPTTATAVPVAAMAPTAVAPSGGNGAPTPAGTTQHNGGPSGPSSAPPSGAAQQGATATPGS
ncbi:unnamed protein product [Amoebophrya sp. A25]|nr:unnamed protein product [Amoebophrya sp. A25]|eukprot:GSA25T00025482001.1